MMGGRPQEDCTESFTCIACDVIYTGCGVDGRCDVCHRNYLLSLPADKEECYCNLCDTKFMASGPEDIVCPRCGVGVVTSQPVFLTHPANKPMSITKAREIISWLGWQGFVRALPGFAKDNPELRPKKRKTG